MERTYDLNDNLIEVVEKESADDPDPAVTGYAYDVNGNLTTMTDPDQNTVTFAYDLMDRIASVTDERNATTRYTYDVRGRVAAVSDALDHTVDYGYDARGLLTRITNALAQTWIRTYDAEGLLAAEIGPTGRRTTYARDRLGQVTALTDPLGHTTAFTRDAAGRITEVIAADSTKTVYAYDAAGHLSAVTLPAVGTAVYARTADGDLAGVQDLNGHAWTFDYTSQGVQTTRRDPLDNTWHYTFDKDRLTRVDYPDGAHQTLAYDARDNVIERSFSDGTVLDFQYDDQGRLLSADGVSLAYDPTGNLTSTVHQTAAGSLPFTASYDLAARLIELDYGGRLTVTYAYDSRNRLTRVSDDLSGTVLDLTYNAEQELIGIVRSNGVATTYTRDAAGRIIRQQDGGIIDIAYTLDAVGRIRQVDYVSVPLDPSGIALGDKAFSVNAACEITSSGFAYAPRGRLTAAGGAGYIWDDASRLTQVAGMNLAHNGLNDLTAVTTGGQTSGYAREHAITTRPVLVETNQTYGQTTGQDRRYYVWGTDGVLLYGIDAATGAVIHYHFDAYSGSTLALTDAAGHRTDAYAYSPYGELLQHDGPSDQPFTFVGRYGVIRLGPAGTSGELYHMRDRVYDAYTGRFISRDRIWPDVTNPLGLNPYQYANLDPVSLVDPLGMNIVKRTQALFNKVRGVGESMKKGATTANEVKGLVDNLNALRESAEQFKKQLLNAGDARGTNEALDALKEVFGTIDEMRGALEGAALSSEHLANALKGLNMLKQFKGLQNALGKFGQAAGKFGNVAGKLGPALAVAQGLADFARHELGGDLGPGRLG